MKNFHLPLPDDIYAQLRTEAERAQVPATTLARGGYRFVAATAAEEGTT
jgi:hypothetical protein